MLGLYLAACFLLYQLWLRLVKVSSRKPDDGASEIPTLGYWEVAKVALESWTKYRHMSSYEFAFNLAKKRGTMLAINLPPQTIINCVDWKTYKAVMSSSVWLDRTPDNYYLSVTSFNKSLGLITGCGDHWKRASQLTIQILHQLDFYNPNKMEESIHMEMDEIEADLDRDLEASGTELIFTPHGKLQPGTLNVIWRVMTGDRFRHDDPVIVELLGKINAVNNEICVGNSILDVFPLLKIFPKLTFLGPFMNAAEDVYGIFRAIIRDKEVSNGGSACSKPAEDLIDGFMQEMERTQGKDPYMTEETLLVVLRDMVMGGADTVNSALEHGLLHVSLQPDIQKRVQEEIDDIIGDTRKPTYRDRLRMPFTQAVLLETLRVSSPVPLTGRTNIEDTVVNGYAVKKGSLLTINIYGIHHSEELWGDPYVFRPERFLDDNMNVINSDKIIPFGLGKRTCAGIAVARINLFLFFVRLLQRFEFQISDLHPPPSFENPIGLARHPLPYYVKMRRRC